MAAVTMAGPQGRLHEGLGEPSSFKEPVEKH